ncbi:hypothetical protein DEO72_LG1g2922 [Vigna unguiculata]|uniref:Uncharacterized protein n=1 Tax=Vigna unguiculata TaxID=3917 RepID=A0A4D6KRV8_VIGUN|nr:hypothetical protein DEO72_LG1g2922 [Vigna unguiculata]
MTWLWTITLCNHCKSNHRNQYIINSLPSGCTCRCPSGSLPISPSYHDLPTEKVVCDDSGKIIMTFIDKGWRPNHHATEAIGDVIRTHSRGPYYHYEVIHVDV